MIAGHNREQEEFNPANLTPGMRKYIADREALVRKDAIEEILKSTRKVIKNGFEVEEIFVGDIREYAKANGINL